MKYFKIYFNLILIFINQPLNFINQLTKSNWKTLGRAIMNESPRQIIINAKKLLRKTKTDSIQNIEKNIITFHKSLPKDNKRICVFITHEASRTGAPLIILNLGRHISKSQNLHPIFLICKDGTLNKEFKNSGSTYSFKFSHNNQLLKQELDKVFTPKLKRKIKGIIFNSEGSTFLLKYFKYMELGPRIALIHEMADYYPKNSWKHLNKYADKIVFPANVMKSQAQHNSYLNLSKLYVRGQGLLKPELLKLDKQNARTALRKKLVIPRDSFIILGCGTPIARKGFDIFILTAISVLSHMRTKNTYFLWLGDAPFNEHQLWAKRDINQSGHLKNIILQETVSDTSVWFAGSDVFYLTSRGDPYPCVVHEAFASQLPVIAYKGTGGSEEMINESRGFLCEYGNILEATKYIELLRKNDELLKEKGKFAFNHANLELDFALYSKYIFDLIEE